MRGLVYVVEMSLDGFEPGSEIFLMGVMFRIRKRDASHAGQMLLAWIRAEQVDQIFHQLVKVPTINPCNSYRITMST